MLKYFFENSFLDEIERITAIINQKKDKVIAGNFTDPYQEISESKEIFENIKQYAIRNNDENLANSQYVAAQYLKLFCNMTDYFAKLFEKTYKKSWDKLQDCIELCIEVSKFTEIENRYDIPQIIDLLYQYELLYPYKIFSSPEIAILKSECSICEKPIQSLDCFHITGNLYWGEVAYEKVTEIKTFQAVCLVSHPLDKRCIIELSDDTRSETEKFQKLDEILSLGIPPLQMFAIKDQKSIRQREDIKIVGRNDACSCGSGIKFKKCCGQNLYYEHIHHIVKPMNMVDLKKEYVI